MNTPIKKVNLKLCHAQVESVMSTLFRNDNQSLTSKKLKGPINYYLNSPLS